MLGGVSFLERSNAQPAKMGVLLLKGEGGNARCRTTIIICLTSPTEILRKDPGSVNHSEACWRKCQDVPRPERITSYWWAGPFSSETKLDIWKCRMLVDRKL